MRKWSLFYIVLGFMCAGLFSVTLLASSVSAQEVTLDKIDPAYGVMDYSVEQVSSFAFQGFDSYSDYIIADLDGYRYMDIDGWSFLFVAPVNLPSGVTIDFIGLDYCDSNSDSGADWTLTLVDMSGDHVTTTVGSITPPDRTGCGYAYNSTPLDYQFETNEGHHLAIFADQIEDTQLDGSMKFRGAEIWYKRMISPAPSTATFSDVPITHPFFQHIEAMAASGITTGYPDGTFRPGDYITRQAMAAFLARALGLHWPD